MNSTTRSTDAHVTTTVIFLALSALAAAGLLRTRPDGQLTGELNRRDALSGRLDPNVAAWWELSHLPGIGETRAKAIVEYRETVRAGLDSDAMPVFRGAADLTKVRGIGAKTAQRIAPWLTLVEE